MSVGWHWERSHLGIVLDLKEQISLKKIRKQWGIKTSCSKASETNTETEHFVSQKDELLWKMLSVKLLRKHLRPMKLTKLKRIPWLSLRLCIFLSTFTFLPWAEKVEIIIIDLQIKKLRSEKIGDFPKFHS